jgi:hypothetical protein
MDTISDFSTYVTPCKITLAQRTSCVHTNQNLQHPAAVSRTSDSSTLVSRPVMAQNILSGIQKSYHSEVSKSGILLPEVLLDEGSHALYTSQDEIADKFLASNPSVKEVGGNRHVRVVTETDFFRLQQTVSHLQHQLLLALGERESRSEITALKSSSLPDELSETHHIIFASPPDPVSKIVEVVFGTLSRSHSNKFFAARVAPYSGQVRFFDQIQRLF